MPQNPLERLLEAERARYKYSKEQPPSLVSAVQEQKTSPTDLDEKAMRLKFLKLGLSALETPYKEPTTKEAVLSAIGRTLGSMRITGGRGGMGLTYVGRKEPMTEREYRLGLLKAIPSAAFGAERQFAPERPIVLPGVSIAQEADRMAKIQTIEGYNAIKKLRGEPTNLSIDPNSIDTSFISIPEGDRGKMYPRFHGRAVKELTGISIQPLPKRGK
jgi:hypothetical protein